MAKKREKHEKLTPIEGKPGDLRRRMPGWIPDCVQEEDEDSGLAIGDLEVIYPEEFIKIVHKPGEEIQRTPFQPDFNNATKWILGGKLHKRSTKSEEDKTDRDKFLDWLHDISNRVRNYNASLYRLRYLRLKSEGVDMKPLPTDPDPDPKPGPAAKDFRDNVKLLREILPPQNPDRKGDIVEFVTVNGYIVSIRAVAHVFDKKKLRRTQPGGSESSQWSLSSRFSSSMSKKSDPKEKKRAAKKTKKKK